MLVTSISLGDVETLLPTMEDCLNARQSIIEQQADAKVLCVPYSQEQTKSDEMRDMFSAFMEMIIQLRSYEENYGSLGEENRQCKPCYEQSSRQGYEEVLEESSKGLITKK